MIWWHCETCGVVLCALLPIDPNWKCPKCSRPTNAENSHNLEFDPPSEDMVVCSGQLADRKYPLLNVLFYHLSKENSMWYERRVSDVRNSAIQDKVASVYD